MSERKIHVLLLNADFTPMSYVTVEHSFRMLSRGVAIVQEEHPTMKFDIFNLPLKLRLIRYVNMSWYYAKPVHWSKRGVMIRDRKLCVYCYGKADTIDHLMPTSRGGQSTWANCVACCFKCNQKKNNHTLEEMGWELNFKPRAPLRTELAMARIELIDAGV